MKTVKIREATEDSFREFGWIITEPKKQPDEDLEDIKYWDKLVFIADKIEDLNLGFLKAMKRTIICSELELIRSAEEFYICLDGEPAIMFVAPGNRSAPDASKISAFNLNGKSCVIRRGVWHWAPFPLYKNSNYALFTSGGCMITVENKVAIDPNVVTMFKLKEPVTIDVNQI
jgi:ureidoglycolate hydrolase